LRRALGVIPARFDSSRFPGKPLALILGKTMIQRVYERALASRRLDRVIIATDDDRILKAANEFGAEAWMTSREHESGTDRVAEVSRKLDFPIVINIQGDEPLLSEGMVGGLVEVLQREQPAMASLMARVYDLNLLADSNRVKVVVDKEDFALYFSRAPLPFRSADFFFQHIGIYGYSREFLLKFGEWPVSRLEKMEKLEQLRALENGCRIKMIEVPSLTLSVDSPQDIIRVEEILRREKNG
jgi:3-deoxy-manno-octulosonate cytidylyltransferase (CMP-KDO synthetase)